MMVTLVVGIVLASSGAVGLSASPSADAINTVDGTNLTTENETTPHKNPDTISESGDTEQVASYLSGQLGSMLAGAHETLAKQNMTKRDRCLAMSTMRRSVSM